MHSRSLPLALLAALATVGCGDDTEATVASTGQGSSTGTGASHGSSSSGAGGATGEAPTVTSNAPVDGATGVEINGSAGATFSEPMDCTTLSAETFTLAAGSTALSGTVVCSGANAVFWPTAHLPADTVINATVTTGAQSLAGVALDAAHEWSFTTSDVVGGAMPVALGAAGDYAILAKAAISSVPTSAITGNVGLSPAAATFITGFSLTADSSNVFSTSPQVTGRVYAADYAVPTPSDLTAAVGDMEIAFTDAAARAPDVTELGAGNIGGMTLAAGVYKWGTGLLVPTDVVLDGNATDVWIFQIAQDLTVSSGVTIILTGGALPENVFWQVAGLVDIGTTAHFEGIVLTQTAVTLRTGASLEGRLFAQTAVDLDANAVVQPE